MPEFMRVAALGSRILGWAALGGTVLILLAIGIGPRTGAYQVRTVLTGSMRPAIPEGSFVVLTPVSFSDLRVNDVITYRSPAEDRPTVTHRIVEIKVPGPRPVVLTKGDANPQPDPWLAHLRGDEAWKASLSIPWLGHAFETLRQPVLRLIMVLVAPALLALVTLVQLWAPSHPSRSRGGGSEPWVVTRQTGSWASPQERWQRWRERWPAPAMPQLMFSSQQHWQQLRERRATAESNGAVLSEQERWQQWRERRAEPRPKAGMSDA